VNKKFAIPHMAVHKTGRYSKPRDQQNCDQCSDRRATEESFTTIVKLVLPWNMVQTENGGFEVAGCTTLAA
jgi:hypothetical protein